MQVFSQVRAELPPLIAALRGAPASSTPDAAWLSGTWDVKRQADLCLDVVRELGFDEAVGRLDVSVHPFTGGPGPTDVRMTTRFKEHDITEGLTGAVHECGHALYEQGRNAGEDFAGLPVSAALSMGVHESQSLLWERMVALSPEFCAWLMPRAQAVFPEFGQGKTAQVSRRRFDLFFCFYFLNLEHAMHRAARAGLPWPDYLDALVHVSPRPLVRHPQGAQDPNPAASTFSVQA